MRSNGVFGKLAEISRLKSFHTPGHGGRLNKLDSTEVEQLFPLDSVEDAQRRAAEHYGAKHVRFLVNGSSEGIKCAVMTVAGDFIAPADRHRAVDEAAALARVNIVSVENQTSDGLPMPLTAEQIERAYGSNKSVRAVLVQSPDYYGQVADLGSIRRVCDRLGLIMIVDSAHGAHFASRTDLFPENAAAIADFANLSAHKTMMAYTQSAYLAVNRSDLMDGVDANLRLLGTTSPSYVLLGQLERAIEYERKNAGRYDALVKQTELFRLSVKCRKSDDPMRITVDASDKGMSGEEMYRKLLRKGIAAEKATDRYVVFIVTLAHRPSDIIRLRKTIERL